MHWIRRVFGKPARRQGASLALQPALIMALEPRMMFDGAVAVSAAEASKPTGAQDVAADKGAVASASKDTSGDASHAAATGDVRSTDSVPAAAAGSGHNVVFVDSRVEDAQQLLKGVAANTDVVYLDRNGNGVQQMAQYLAAHPGAASVQIIAHGNDGDLWLGNSYVSAENIADYGAALSQLGANMQAGGDILIYACNTAQGERGQTLVNELASLTGRDIAASDDRTGNGSDWDLEVTTGNIEARPVLAASSEAAYQHDLALLTVTSNADSGAGSLRDAIASAASGDTITFSSAMTVTLSSGQLSIGKSLTIEGDIDGNGTADVTVDANYTSRVLYIASGNVKLDGLVIEHGLLFGNGGSGGNALPPDSTTGVDGGSALGAGIYVASGATLTLTHSIVTSNFASGGGGGGAGALGVGFGGGGGGGINGSGGGGGGNSYSYYGSSPHSYSGAPGGGGVGGNGGTPTNVANVQFAGKGGSTSGGAGGIYYTALGNGGSAGTAGGIGGGGGGAGYGPSNGGVGGAAAAGIYIQAGGVLYVANTTITGNAAVGGGGGGSGVYSYSGGAIGVAGAGGSGTGGILNKGTLHYNTTNVSFTGNAGAGGTGGASGDGSGNRVSAASGDSSADLLNLGTLDPNWPPNTAPVVGNLSGDSVSYTEDGSAALLDAGSNATVNDSDSADFAGGNLTVSIAANRVASEDVLSILNQGTGAGQIGVSGSNVTYGGVTIGTFSGGSGSNDLVILFNASATAAAAQALIRDIAYSNSNSIDPSTATRTVRFTVNDGDGGTSSAADVTVSVTAVNDAPTLSATGGTPTYVENGAAVDLFSGVAVSTVESGQSIDSIGLTVSGLHDGSREILSIDGTAVALTNGNSLTTAANGYIVSVTVSGGTASVSIDKSGGMSTSAAQSLVDGLSYSDNGDNPTAGARVVTLTRIQDSGGTANGGVDTTALSIAATVTVQSVNDAPVLAASSGSASFVAGDNVASTPVVIDSGLTVSDVDSSSLASATVSVTGNFQAGEDVLGFTNDGASMGNIAASYNLGTGVLTLSSAGGNATLAQWQAALRAVTYTDTAITPNTATRTISFVANDGALDSGAVSRTVTVADTDQTPILTASGGTTTFTEGNNTASTPVVVDGGLTVSDLDNISLASATVAITGNLQSGEDVLAFTNDGSTMGNIAASYDSTTGVLTLTSAGASATLAQWQAALRSVTYTDTSDTPNTANRTISFTVNDGTKTSAAANRTVSVVATNDTPVLTGSGGNAAFTEDGAAVVVDGGLTISDPDSGTLASATVAITGNFQSGEDVLAFTNDGSTMGNITASYDSATGVLSLSSAGALASLAQWQAALRSVTYADSSQAPITSNRTLSFSVNDGGTSSAASTRTVTVSAVNDAPVNLVPAVQQVDQNASLTFNAGNGNLISISDVDGGGGVELVTLTASNGLLTLSGTSGLSFLVGSGTGDATMTFEGTLADLNAALNGLVFTPTVGYNGSASIQITSNDLGQTGAGGSKTDTDTVAITVRGLSPLVTNVDSSSADGSYKVGQTVSITVTFDQAVTVSGTPTLLLETGAADRSASYVSGSGSNTLTFAYVVQAGDLSADLDFASASALSVNGGSISNASTGSAILTLPSPGAAHSLGANRNIVIDGVAPTVISVAVPANGTYVAGQSLDFTVNASESLVVDATGGTPRLLVTVGSQQLFATYLSGSGTTALTFRLTVANGELDTDGVALGASLDLNGATVRDAAGNDVVATLNGVASTTGVKVDAVAPSMTGVEVPANGAYTAGDQLTFTVSASEAVLVDTSGGTPRLALNIGGSTVFANYVSGSGTRQLVFTYTVLDGQLDADGIGMGDQILANGARLTDAAGNAANLQLGPLPSTAGVLVQGPTSSVAVQPRVTPDLRPDLPRDILHDMPPTPPIRSNTSPLVLGLPPLLDSTNRGQAQTGFSRLFRDPPAQSHLALVFASANGDGPGDGSAEGRGLLGLEGEAAGVFDATTLASIFKEAQRGSQTALNAFERNAGAAAGERQGAFAGLGQQLHALNQRELRLLADLAQAFDALGRERPAR